MGYAEAEVAEFVKRRIARQAIFALPEPPDTTILTWEPVLHHQIGTAETMRQQLDQLLALPSTAVIQVVPGSHSVSNGGANCVEAGSLPGQVLIRDTTDNGHGPVLRVSARTWRAFATAVRAQ